MWPLELLAAWLPVLMPSWRFFDRIGPALRIEFALTDTPDVTAAWQPLRPRQAAVSRSAMVRRLFWNPHGNETLYLTNCAERLLDDPSPQRADVLWTRAAGLIPGARTPLGGASSRFLRIRIVETMREDDVLVTRVVFVSEARRLVRDRETDGP